MSETLFAASAYRLFYYGLSGNPLLAQKPAQKAALVEQGVKHAHAFKILDVGFFALGIIHARRAEIGVEQAPLDRF